MDKDIKLTHARFFVLNATYHLTCHYIVIVIKKGTKTTPFVTFVVVVVEVNCQLRIFIFPFLYVCFLQWDVKESRFECFTKLTYTLMCLSPPLWLCVEKTFSIPIILLFMFLARNLSRHRHCRFLSGNTRKMTLFNVVYVKVMKRQIKVEIEGITSIKWFCWWDNFIY